MGGLRQGYTCCGRESYGHYDSDRSAPTALLLRVIRHFKPLLVRSFLKYLPLETRIFMQYGLNGIRSMRVVISIALGYPSPLDDWSLGGVKQ